MNAEALLRTAKRNRKRRRSRPRPKTITRRRMVREVLSVGARWHPHPDDVDRPVTRADCSDVMRPCPFVSCKYHLYLDVDPKSGSLKLNFPELEPWELYKTCALDVAERGGLALEEIGHIMNLTRERVRQIEGRALLKIRRSFPPSKWEDWAP